MTLPLNALTPRSRAVFVLAAEIAQDAGHGYVGTEHLLLALAREGHGIAAQVLDRLNVRERVMEELQSIVETEGPSGQAPDPGDEVRVFFIVIASRITRSRWLHDAKGHELQRGPPGIEPAVM